MNGYIGEDIDCGSYREFPIGENANDRIHLVLIANLLRD